MQCTLIVIMYIICVSLSDFFSLCHNLFFEKFSTIIPSFQLPRNGASNQSSSWPPSLLASRPLNVEHPPPNQNPPGGLSKLGGFQISKRFINDGLIWCSSQIHVSWEDMLGIYVVSTYMCRYKPFPFISYAMTNFSFSGAFQQVSWKSDQGHWSRWRVC